MNLSVLRKYQEKPEPFTPGEKLFWDDPHISKQLLTTHLDPNIDLASRKPVTIKKSVNWMIKELSLGKGDPVLDLGCGPGLYAVQFAKAGCVVCGIDYSKRSIAYANKYAEEQGLVIEYRYQDYLTLNESNRYLAAFLIFGDFCVLSPEQRKKMLANISRSLKPGGNFVLDVSTRKHRQKNMSDGRWYISEGGFWRSGRHLVLEKGFDYEELSIYLNQTIVIENNGQISVYRNWFQDYDQESIIEELEGNNFIVESVWSNLQGTPISEDTEWIGIITRKR